MIVMDKPNPFFVLALSTDATKAEIVARGQELYETAETKEQGLLYRWAMEQLITKPRTRLEYELFELPSTQYEDSEWESFIRMHRRKPIDLVALAQDIPAPGIDDINMGAVMQLFLDSMLTVTEPDIRVAIDGSPYMPVYQLSMEVKDVLFG
jgi:hypothetical protein